MSSTSNILYGGYEGSDCEICENSQSLGEVILNKFRALDDKIVLVYCDCCVNDQNKRPN